MPSKPSFSKQINQWAQQLRYGNAELRIHANGAVIIHCWWAGGWRWENWRCWATWRFSSWSKAQSSCPLWLLELEHKEDLSAGQPQLDCNQGLGFGCENKCNLHSIFIYFKRYLFFTLRPALIFLCSKVGSSTKRTRGCGEGKLGNKWNSVIFLMSCIVLIKLFGCSQTSASLRLIYRSWLLPVWDQEV